MITKGMERAAYIAAHRIVAATAVPTEFACPGARRSHAIDTIAEIIRSTLEWHVLNPDEEIHWPEPMGQPGLQLVNQRQRQSGELLEFPARVSF